jgi:phage gp29-like protein
MATPSIFQRLQNVFVPPQKTNYEKNLNNYISRVQLQRLRHDVQMWRDAITEAESAYYPHRVKMQRMFVDTILNGHTLACINRRKNLTLLKEWAFIDESENQNDKLKKTLDKKWFSQCLEYALDAQFFGYTLIALNDLENGEFPYLKLIRRWNVSPDRLNVNQYVYSLSGVDFTEPPYSEWHLWVDTPSNIGISDVGYGLLYNVAIYEIMCRNLLGNNADASELYGMPTRVGTTSKTEGAERDAFEQALANMGSAGYIVKDPLDEIELVESSISSQGFKIFGEFEKRLEQKISKLILGHADAMDSTPGKLGGGQGGTLSPAQMALDDIMQIDSKFVEDFVNNNLLPKLRNLGFAIDEKFKFAFVNNIEKELARVNEDKNNKVTSDIALTMKNAGLEMDATYFTERTGIPATKTQIEQTSITESVNKVKNKLEKLYK